jgi:TPR repeat protein
MLLTAAFSVHADTRVALVIGNGAYERTRPLTNPVHDATDIAAALGKLGYTVQLVTNVHKPALEAALKQLGRLAASADQIVVYYSGHGIEAGGVNYLLPVEVTLETESDAPLEAVSLSEVMGVASRARRLGLVVLDACRNNPFANSMQRANGTKGVTKGLAAVEPAGNLLVAYATRDGHTADDGTGRNSPYTKAILQVLPEKGLEVSLFWRTVRDRVMADTHSQQVPVTYGDLGAEQLYLNPPAASIPPPAVQYDPRAAELALWQSAQHNDTADAYRDYLKHFPEGLFNTQATLRIAALTSATTGGTRVTPSPVSSGTNGPTTNVQTAAQECYRLSVGEKIDGKAALEACERAERESPGDVASEINLGLALERLNRMEEAAVMYRKAADQGYAKAQYSLGRLYDIGQGVPQSYTEAVKWYRLAADQGFAQAQGGLGELYYYGHGVPQSHTEALKWYRLAADQGLPGGQFNLGYMYQHGEELPQSNTEAVKWYRLAAKQGNQNAQTALRQMGEAVP